MLCLSDTDLVLKLAALNIANEAFESVGVARNGIRITPEVSQYLRHRAPLKHPRETIERALTFVSGLKLVPEASIDDIETLKAAEHAIQYGERILIASTAAIKADFILATGDKKCLRALASTEECRAIHDRLSNKCVCLEQLVLAAIADKGFKWVNKRVGTNCRCDECLVHAFANGVGNISEADCRKWLDGYIADLRSTTGKLLRQ